MKIDIKPVKVTRFLFALAFLFTLAHIAGQISEIYLGENHWSFLIDLDSIQSIPRFYDAVTLLLCSGLLLTIARTQKGRNRYNFLCWLGLAIVFLFLAIIENTGIYQEIMQTAQAYAFMSKTQLYIWLYAGLFILFPAVYLKFFLNLPRKLMFMLAIGGFIFIAGTLGLEPFGICLCDMFNRHTLEYISLATFEEVLQMIGIIIFVYGLLLYMSSDLKWIQVKISN